jgi:hypothetical protein
MTCVCYGLLPCDRAQLGDTITHAVDQLKDYDPQQAKQWILYMVISFDGWGEFAGNYFQKIRQFLSENHVPGLQIVINHVKNTGIPRLEIEYP